MIRLQDRQRLQDGDCDGTGVPAGGSQAGGAGANGPGGPNGAGDGTGDCPNQD